jgi:lipoprotein-anchoring transpeptidase ErfK/SrfK
VYAARVATGVPDHPTPHGAFRVLDKRHGQRMTGGLGEGAYNLAGIPWICYFNSTWVATHGCYWHNDYGRRHSNGCVNLLPADAVWVFRWTTPVANYWDFHTAANADAGQPGTRITVRW